MSASDPELQRVLGRPLPMAAIMELGSIGTSPEAVAFVIQCRDEGLSTEEPGDDVLSDDEWDEVVTARCRIIALAWRIYTGRDSG